MSAAAGKEFGQGNRLDQIIVGAHIQGVDAIGDRIACRHDHERQRCVSAANAPHQARAVFLRQAKIHNGEIELLAQ